MSICAPKNKWELEDLLSFASIYNGPIAIRYPRENAWEGLEDYREPVRYGKAEEIYREKDIMFFAEGNMVKTAVKVREVLKEKGYKVSLVNARFIKPFDQEIIFKYSKDHKVIVTFEDNVLNGGFGEGVGRFIGENDIDMEVINIGVQNKYVEHGSLSQIKIEAGIDETSIVNRLLGRLEDIKF